MCVLRKAGEKYLITISLLPCWFSNSHRRLCRNYLLCDPVQLEEKLHISFCYMEKLEFSNLLIIQ